MLWQCLGIDTNSRQNLTSDMKKTGENATSGKLPDVSLLVVVVDLEVRTEN